MGLPRLSLPQFGIGRSAVSALTSVAASDNGLPLPDGYVVTFNDQFSSLDFDTWSPRIAGSTDPKGSYSDAEYAMYIDPAHAGWNGYTPFSVGNGLTITARRVSEMDPAPTGGTVLTDPKTAAAFAWTAGTLQASETVNFRSGIVDVVMNGGVLDPAFWAAAWLRPVGGIYPEIDIAELVGFEVSPTVIFNLIVSAVSSFPDIYDGPDFFTGDHWFRVIITDYALEFYHDGALIYTKDITAVPEAQDEFYPILDVTVGSNIATWVEPPDGSTPSPMSLTFKQVRVARKAGPDSLAMSETTILDANTNGALGTLSHTAYGASTGGTYTLDDNGSGKFSIAGSTVSIDTSTAGTYSFVARVTDNEGNFWRRKFTVTVVADVLGTNTFTTFETDFSNAAWSKFNLTLPTPEAFPQRLQEDTVSAQHALSRVITKPASLLPYTLAVDVEYDGSTEWVKLELGNNYANPVIASYNILTGELGTIYQDSGTIVLRTGRANQNLGGGVRRLLLQVTAAASLTTNFRFQMKTLAADGEFGNRVGSTANGLKVKKVQLVQV